MVRAAHQVSESPRPGAPRYEIAAPVRYRCGGGDWLDGTTINIGRCGLLMRTRQAPPPESTRLELRVALAAGGSGPAAYVACTGRVVRTEPWLAAGDAEVEVALDDFHLRPASRSESETGSNTRSLLDETGRGRDDRP